MQKQNECDPEDAQLSEAHYLSETVDEESCPMAEPPDPRVEKARAGTYLAKNGKRARREAPPWARRKRY